VARVLEKISVADPSVRVIDTHPLASDDPNGLDIFYLMLVATIVGMVTVFQVRGQAPGLELRHHISFVIGLAVLASTVLTLVDGPLLHRPAALYPEEWGILAVHVLAVSSFSSLMVVLFRAWAIVPSWLFFVILGNASSGGAVAPPLLPQPFAFLSEWLPSGATVSALRNAIYFRDYQLARPLVVLGVWAAGLFLAWVLLARRREAQTVAR
jgi:ABC-type multidrug transport system permease subunit